jgi:hypothetical protein
MQAFELYQQGRFQEARGVLEPLVSEAPYNLFVLALARAALREGRCAEARHWLDALPATLPVPQPPLDVIASEARAARQELLSCPGTLALRCVGQPVVTVDEVVLACGGDHALRPGVHQVQALWTDPQQTTVHAVTIEAGGVVPLQLSPPEATTVTTRGAPVRVEHVLVGVGATLSAAAFAAARLWHRPAAQRFDNARARRGTEAATLQLQQQVRSRRVVVGGLAVAGGGLLLGGAATWAW